ncbi:MAG: glycosyltransferase family 4 protein [Oscillospiraceae bacterium]|nr:glycosyltransferase family 4 protein [Oscillospiraceae bacterium]
MKILLVNYEYKGQGGGAGQQMYYLAKALRDFGHDVSLLIGWDKELGTPEMLDGVTTHIVKHKRKNIQLSTPLGMLFFVFRGLREINKLTKTYKYDIIQFYFCVPTGILKYGIHGKVPYVVSLRGMDIPGLHSDRNKGLSKLTSSFNKNISRKAVAVTCNSTESYAIFHSFAPEIPITIIPNAFDSDIECKHFYSETVKSFVYVGRLIYLKRIDLLIDAVIELRKAYPDVTLDIFGQGYLFDELMQQIKDNEADEFITLKGYINKSQLTEALCNYDLFLFASVSDSCPNVLLEAMAAGLPVVAARAGGSIDIVEDGVTGLFTAPGDLGDAIEKLEYCINNPTKMKEFGIAGRQRVQRQYSLEYVGQRHIEIFGRSEKVVNVDKNA